MNPPPGAGYLQFGDTDPGAAESVPPPFTDDWDVSAEEIDENEELAPLILSPRDRAALAGLAKLDPLALAVALERAVNGTSLVLLFEFAGAFLLFPGDAQWGTWKLMLQDENVMALLEHTTFLKVGHHGSHNATPRAFLEGLISARARREGPPDLWVMASTRPIAMWKEIPKAELIEALRGATPNFARSDDTRATGQQGFTRCDDEVIEAVIPLTSMS
jgi:hypothetical protein